MTANKKTPALRFKEFEGEWEEKKLGELFTITAGGDIQKENVSELCNEIFKYPIYANAEKDKGFYAYSDIYKIEEGVITVAGRGVNIGIAHARHHKFYPIVRLLVLIPKRGDSIKFFEYAINRLNILVESTGVPQLTVPQFSRYHIIFPITEEQQKIASFLTAVDDKIQQLTKKKALLEQYKKGVMQQIFNQQIRFKDDDGKDYPDWEEKKLGEITRIFDGTHMTPDYKQTGIPFYSVEHITSNNFSNTRFISEEIYHKENQRVKLEKGDILMTRIGDIGTSKYIYWDVKASFYVSLALIKSPLNQDAKFLDQYIKSEQFQIELYKRTIHVAFPKKINLGEIGECNVELPCLEEQQKIANFLTGIDNKINAVGRQLEQTQVYKKGLLQQMFV